MCKCPCGHGEIVKHVTTQDNPWSSADIAYSIDCAKCSAEWRLEYEHLVLRSSEVGYKASGQHLDESFKPLHKLVNTLVADYFASFAAKSKKAELAEMARLGICDAKYPAYLRYRREGKSPADICYGLKNIPWLMSLAEMHGLKDSLELLISNNEKAKVKCNEAYSKIIRRKIA